VVTNVSDLLRTAASVRPDGAALKETATGRELTWAQLDELVDRAASGYLSLGLIAGYRAMIVSHNSVEFIASYLAALRVGLVAVPTNPRSTVKELTTVIADATPRVVLADATTIDLVRRAVTDAAVPQQGDQVEAAPRVVAMEGEAAAGERSWAEFTEALTEVAPPPADAEALAALLYTSGTSGNPRGAMLTHRALLANIEQVANSRGAMVRPDDVVLGLLPLFHVYGLNAVLGQVINQQAVLVVDNGFDPIATLDLIAREQVTVLPIVPVAIAHWMSDAAREIDLAAKLSSVRLVLCGSAPLSPELGRSFAKRTGLEVHQGYGLTEASPVVTLTLSNDTPTMGAVGSVVPGVEVSLADETGSAPEPGDSGEILIRGDNLFSGYWPDGADGPDGDGWWATGDMGFLDPSGELFLVDRVKELVIVSGFNVYPIEVEEVLEELPEVESAAVIGVDDPLTGEAVVAYLKPAEGVTPAAVKQAAEEHVVNQLARFKQPTQWHVVSDLPYTVTGKVRKGLLRATERRRALGLLG
jgi:long-chain acyl-CoA synthetase